MENKIRIIQRANKRELTCCLMTRWNDSILIAKIYGMSSRHAYLLLEAALLHPPSCGAVTCSYWPHPSDHSWFILGWICELNWSNGISFGDFWLSDPEIQINHRSQALKHERLWTWYWRELKGILSVVAGTMDVKLKKSVAVGPVKCRKRMK